MCGIIGSVNSILDENICKQSLVHRGPDEQNSIVLDNVFFYHLRLTILDAEGGKQPMSLDKRYYITFNGEIYNHLDVRKKLGLNCKTRSDTETILHAFRLKGIECLHYFDGMFAFAIYDNVEKQLTIARDRAGKKPLYLYRRDDQVIFASELNTIKALHPLQKNLSNINDYLQGGLLGKETSYENVEELPGGSVAIINTQSVEVNINKWWSINNFYNNKNTDEFATAKNKVNNHLRTAVERRLDSSDLEVGTFLSGGIDSGIVTAIAAEFKEGLKAFTISFDGAYDESELAKLVAQKYNLEHHVIPLTFDNLQNDFEKIVHNYGGPFSDSSAIPSYYVAREAKKNLTVILNGDGADELFAGYRRYVPYAKYDFYNKGPLLTNAAKLLKSILPITHNKKSSYNYIYRLVDIMTKDKSKIYWSTTSDTFSGFFDRFQNQPSVKVQNVFDLLSSIENLTGLQKQMNLDFEIILPGLLKKMDIATMANSLEGRSPFLCKELLEYAPSIDDNYKVKGKRTKHILRSIAEDYLPSELIHQPKRGFEIPLKAWIGKDLAPFVEKYLTKKGRFVDQFIESTFIDALLKKQIKVSDEKRAKMLYKLLVTELWATN